jgi:myo-inositol 2-dehydrogenase/D-chiro-inositol 1-dehydrogenase
MTVRIGIIGPGGMGKAHIDRVVNELAGGEVVAVFDVDAANAAAVAGPLGARVHASSDELIAAPDVDAVMVTSGGPFHEADLLKAIEAGKPVFCEKPLTPTAEAAVRVMAAEQAAGRKLVTVGFMRRFDRSYNEMKAILDARELGEAILVHNRHRNPTVPESYTADMAINDTAIHEIDTMRWLLGEEIVRVRVDKPKPTTNRFPHLQDPLVVVMQTESGVHIDDEVFVNIQYAYDIQCELVLESGTVALSDQHVISRRDASGARNAMTMNHNERFHLAFNAELQQWINAVAKGEHAGSSSWDGYAAAVVCDAGVQALESDENAWVDVVLMPKPVLYA